MGVLVSEAMTRRWPCCVWRVAKSFFTNSTLPSLQAYRRRQMSAEHFSHAEFCQHPST